MCEKIKILSKVKSGELSFCSGCQSFHLVFNNLFFALTRKELKKLKSYLDGLEVDYWEKKYACSDLNRKIPLPTQQPNLVLMFNKQELMELRILLSYLDKKPVKEIAYLGIDDIDYKYSSN